MLNTAAATGIDPVTLAAVVRPPPETLTGMLTVPAVAVTVPVTVIAGKLAPGLSESLRVHVKPGGVPLIVHAQPFPWTKVIVKPLGGSVTVVVPLVLPALAALDTVMEYVASV